MRFQIKRGGHLILAMKFKGVATKYNYKVKILVVLIYVYM